MTDNTYRADIDGIRAIAVISVIIFHAFPKILPGGFSGVDIFFVISGYLITGIIIKSQATHTFDIIEFYKNRIRRIFPALICVLILCLVAGWILLLASEFKALGKHIGFGSVYLSNFALQKEAGYFDINSELKPLLHLWSLSIEEQFYLIWPVLLILTKRLNFNALLIISASMLASFFLNIRYIHSNPSEVFFYPISRAWELLVGSLLAYANIYMRSTFAGFLKKCGLHNADHSNNNFHNIVAGFGVLSITVCLFGFSRDLAYPGWWATLPVIGTLLLIAAGPNAFFNRTVLSHTFSSYIGKISYPLYLWHWPILSFSRIINSKEPSILWKVIALIASTVLASLTLKYIENNVRYKKNKYVSIGLFISLLVTGALGAAIYLENGIVNRYPTQEILASDFEWNSKNLFSDESCQLKFGTKLNQYCKIYDVHSAPTIALIGDSTSNHFYPGLALKLARNHENLLNLGRGVCPPLLGVKIYYSTEGDRKCEQSITQIIDSISSNNSIHTVMLSLSESSYMNRGKDMVYPGKPDLVKSLDILDLAMRNTLQKLSSQNKQVILITGVPDLDFDPKECTDIRPIKISTNVIRAKCEIPTSVTIEKYRAYQMMLQNVLRDYPQVQTWNAAETICDKQRCTAEIDARLLYRDAGHLSEFGSVYVGQKFNMPTHAEK